MATLNDTADYILVKTLEAGVSVDHLKLQKLVYYAQAWHLAFYKKPLFDGKFQAWVHGPVSRPLFARFAITKSLYSAMSFADLQPFFTAEQLSLADRNHIDGTISEYGKFTGSQLEALSHAETPWILARRGYVPSQRCEVEIDEQVMTDFYSKLVDGPASAT